MNYSQTPVIDLTAHLKKLSRDLQRMKTERRGACPSTPEDYLNQAGLDVAIEDLEKECTEIGKALLKKDEENRERRVAQLDNLRDKGSKDAKELLARLPSFSSDLHVALTALGNQYAELLSLSKSVKSTNQALLNANKPPCVQSAIKIEPTNLHKLVKAEIVSRLGSDAADTFVPRPTRDGSIIDDVALIQLQCASGE